MIPLLEAKSLSKTFDTAHSSVSAVGNISFTVAAGEFLCIVGPSGCGKTTILQLLAGLLPPTEGQVLLAGQPLTEPPPEISVVFQKPDLMPWRTVSDNVILPLQILAMVFDQDQDAEE